LEKKPAADPHNATDLTSTNTRTRPRYGFAPKPESASRLTQFVARQDCDVDEIVRVIEKDPA
jgi:HD-like signal output (HDOD) protein